MQKTFADPPADGGKASLYGLARKHALEQLRHRRRPAWPAPDREGFVFTQVDAARLSELSAVLFDRELIELVWDSAAALSAEEHALLDLHVRRDLSAAELAEQVGAATGTIDARLARLRDSFEETVTSALLSTRGRRSCGQLDAVLSELGDDCPRSEAQKAVRQHLRECRQCQESKRRFVSPTEVLGSLAAVPATPALRERIRNEIDPQPATGLGTRFRRGLARLRLRRGG